MFKVAYATGSRADYGIVRSYLQMLNSDKNIDLSILVTGSIIDSNYGETIELIKADGFKIANIIDMKLSTEKITNTIHSMSIALDLFGEELNKNKYDLLIILGDRYEMMSVAIAAAMQNIPILHIHGGEITEGNYDDFIRHCITEMSVFHITSTEEYKKRVIQLGNNPDNVLNGGALGAENCKVIDINNVSEKTKSLKNENYFVVLFHPETLTSNSPENQISILLSVLKRYIDNYKFIFIGSNADTGSDKITNKVQKFCEDNENALYVKNLHPDDYHYMVKNSCALIGNSSSGLIEAPSLNVYTINIGDRQGGRIRGNSVIDIKCEEKQIINAIETVINEPLIDCINPYYQEDSCSKYYDFTKVALDKIKANNVRKKFYDL